jgi:LmbE family N-acetylglucosaminyl deacetylase
MINHTKKKVAVIVAHPDDETLWAGGTILSHNNWDCFIVSLCRANDNDRAPKFFKALKTLNAKGIMGNLNDGPEQTPIAEDVVEQLILNLLPNEHFDLIITHHPLGEYTRHLRHEEVGKAVINLWNDKKISTDTLWLFAYEDGKKTYFPQPVEKADVFIKLPNTLWLKKYSLITKTYDFNPESWEAETTPKTEAFWQFIEALKAKNCMENILTSTKNKP